MRPWRRGLSSLDAALVVALFVAVTAAAVGLGQGLLGSQHRVAVARAVQSVAEAAREYGRAAGGIAALGTDPLVGADRLIDAGMIPGGMGRPSAAVDALRLPGGHRVGVSVADGPEDERLGVNDGRGIVVAVGDAVSPVRDVDLCLELVTAGLPGLRGVEVRVVPHDPTLADRRIWRISFGAPGSMDADLRGLRRADAVAQCETRTSSASGAAIAYAVVAGP